MAKARPIKRCDCGGEMFECSKCLKETYCEDCDECKTCLYSFNEGESEERRGIHRMKVAAEYESLGNVVFGGDENDGEKYGIAGTMTVNFESASGNEGFCGDIENDHFEKPSLTVDFGDGKEVEGDNGVGFCLGIGDLMRIKHWCEKELRKLQSAQKLVVEYEKDIKRSKRQKEMYLSVLT